MLLAEEPYQQYGHNDEYHQVAQTDGNGKPQGQVGEEIALLHRHFIFCGESRLAIILVAKLQKSGEKSTNIFGKVVPISQIGTT